jgi:hypothetical protein
MPTFLSNIWTNPFTSTGAAATAILGVLHALGVNTFGLDSGTLAAVIGSITGLIAADPGKGGK